MKRTIALASLEDEEEEEAIQECPFLAPEIWEFVLLMNPTSKALEAMLFLNKCLSQYLRDNSELLREVAFIFKLNKKYEKTSWFICDTCNRLKVEPQTKGRLLFGNACEECLALLLKNRPGAQFVLDYADMDEEYDMESAYNTEGDEKYE